jgi:hypothetical protein
MVNVHDWVYVVVSVSPKLCKGIESIMQKYSKHEAHQLH